MLVPLVLLVGVATGVFVRPTIDRLVASESETDDHDHAPPVHEDDEHPEDHLPLSFEAVQNLKLRIQPIELTDFTETRRMPGEIIESPGLSSLKVAAPVSGRVAQVFASPGVSIAPGDKLLELEIIDDDLMQAQLRLLELSTDDNITSAEIKRLEPLAESGGIAGKKMLDLQYKKQEITASLSRARQELAMRGLAADQIETIEQSGMAIQMLTVVAPPIGRTANSDGATAPGATSPTVRKQLESTMAMEDLHVEIGENVTRGRELCSLAVHGLLMVCGHAFENDVDWVSQIAAENAAISIEFGASEQAIVESGFHIQHLSGHVDQQTQTFHFFIPLANEMVRDSQDSLGRVFRTWRYKVGQRVHVLVPTNRLQSQIVLPREAVVQVGPEYFVFREVQDDNEAHANGIYMEMEPVPVRIETRSKGSYVIKPGGQVHVGDPVAVNAAYQMHLALKAQKEGGGGAHDHGHTH